jgi:hypothetical protein
VVVVSAGTSALAALVAGGYISARKITPKSVLHPAIAGVVMVMMYLIALTSGDTSPIDVALIVAGAVLPAAGAAVAGRSRLASNNGGSRR